MTDEEPNFAVMRTPSSSSYTPTNEKNLLALKKKTKPPVSLSSFKELSSWEKFYVTLYNLLEPCLIAFLIATTIEVVSIGTATYLLICWGVMVPLLLTKNLFYLKTKYVLAYVLCGLSFADIFMKMWIYIGFTENIT